MRLTSVIYLGLFLMPSLSWGQDFQRLPKSFLSRWQCSRQAPPGWHNTGFAARGWQPVVEVAGRYPLTLEPEAQALHRFMWGPRRGETGPVYFRRHLWLPGKVTSASALVCADDHFDFYVNGHGLGQGRQPHQGFTYDLQPYLRRGANVLGVKAWDVEPPARGLLVAPQITQTWPVEQGRGWRCTLTTATQNTNTPWPKAGPDWAQPEYDDRAWLPAAGDTAPPIKLHDLPPYACLTLPGGLPEFATALFRRTLEIDGLPVSASIVILADDSYELYVNGTLVALEKRAERSYYPTKLDVRHLFKPGKNTLAVKVSNDWGPGRLYCVPTVTMAF